MRADVFIQFLASEKHYSPHTIAAYKNDINQFFNFVQIVYSVHDINEIDHNIIRSWLAHHIQTGTTARSVNRKLSSLKSYFRFLIKRNIIKDNPVQKVIAPRIPQKLPVFIEKEKMERFFSMVSFEPGFDGMRSRLVMEILYATGMRVSELIALQHKDINHETMLLLVSGKRNKQRLIPFGSPLASAINDYYESKMKHFGTISVNDYLIVTNKGKKVYPRLIYNIVTSSLRLVTTQRKVSPHVIRHTFATGMLNNGADLNAIKELLGHSSLAATQVYTHNTIERIKHIYQQAHPKA